MGAYYGGRCYSTVDAANSAHLSSIPVTITQDGHYSYFDYSGTVWRYNVTDPVTNQTTVYAAPSVSYYACNPAYSVIDGITLAFSVVAVWVTAWGVTALRRAL